jgi:hypothetical protein
MNPAAQQLFDFIDDFIPQYINPHGVEFTLNCDGSVYVAFAWDDKLEDKCLEFGITYYHEDFESFLNDFSISSLHQLKAVTMGKLWELYYQEKGEVYCSFGAYFYNNFELHFYRKGNRVIVKCDEDEGYEVHEILKTPRQFMQYTYACNAWKAD